MLCSLGFRLNWGWHAVEASHVSIPSLSSFRAAIGRAVWSSKMPETSTPVLLNLHDGPVGVDPAYHIIWARFSMLRRYLACWPDEVPRVYRMLDLIARGAKGHGPIHLLLDSATQIGFAWDGVEQGWIRESLPPLWMLAGPIQHFRFIGLAEHVMNVNHDLQPELNQGPADLQSTALTTEPCTCVQSNQQRSAQ